MNLSEAYNIVKRGIVAFMPKYIPLQNKSDTLPVFPPILGTGFVVRENGLIATNDHVVKLFPKLFKPPDANRKEWPLTVTLFKLTEKGVIESSLEVLGVFRISQFEATGTYYGPKVPDIAFVHVKAKGLPVLDVEDSLVLEEGIEVATAGFPMGTDALTAPGWLHQITPTLQRGIISAVLPFTCPTPHAFTINVMIQGGASGSPVFLPKSGKVIGMLYAALTDIAKNSQEDMYTVPTNISYVLPAHFIVNSLKQVEGNPNFDLPEDTKSIDELIESAELIAPNKEKKTYQVKQVKSHKHMENNIEKLDLERLRNEVPK